jgi:hypothetical protein
MQKAAKTMKTALGIITALAFGLFLLYWPEKGTVYEVCTAVAVGCFALACSRNE